MTSKALFYAFSGDFDPEEGFSYCIKISRNIDEGISGTNTKYREGFKQMIADALAGKIDLIVTKSVSRFARNTVDSLTAVRQLKEHGVEIFFEKEKRSILEKFVNDFSEFPPEQRLNKTLMVKLVNEIIIFSDSRVIVEMKNGMQITTQQ